MPEQNSVSFGEAMNQLDQVVKQLENAGSLELEEALKLYEQGVHLLGDLRGRLQHAEQKVTELMGKIEDNQKTAV